MSNYPPVQEKPPPYASETQQYPPQHGGQQYPPPPQPYAAPTGPQYGAPPPQQMQYGVPPPQQISHTGQTVVVVTGGNCPRCHAGTLVEDYSTVGIVLAVCFFPIGILCCLAMKERRCTNCRAQC